MLRKLLPGARQVGVFETAFHRTIPMEHRIYPIPYEWYEKYGIMRMGYHGASHSYIAEQANAPKVISCHLGGSCSVCAIENGKSVDSSFGFSLQTGIPHANRVGDVDPYIIPFLMNEGMSMDEVLKGMSKDGGMLGMSGVSNDMREITEAAEAGNKRAELALDVFATSIIRHIGSYYAELGGLDKLVFTGGIGENQYLLRQKICSGLKHMGIVLDEELNSKTRGEGVISTPDSPVTVAVIAANEELGVARFPFTFDDHVGAGHIFRMEPPVVSGCKFKGELIILVIIFSNIDVKTITADVVEGLAGDLFFFCIAPFVDIATLCQFLLDLDQILLK